MRRFTNARPEACGRRSGRLVVAVTAPALLAFAVAGCGTTTPAASPTASTSAGTSTSGGDASPAASPVQSAGPAGQGGNAGQVAACTSGDIKADLIEQDFRRTATTDMAIIKIVNTSSHHCRLDGWATVTLVDAHGDNVPVPTQKVNEPGAPTTTDLPPGTSASAGIKWTVCDKGDASCPVGNSLTVTPPNSTTAVPATLFEFPNPEKSNITMKSLQIGSIQPSGQGVVAW
jgi:hypothetical protein